MKSGSRHTTLLLTRHLLTLLRGRVLRWRLETYGLYAPSLPNQRAWWQVNLRILHGLLARRQSYRGWLEEMSIVRSGGGPGWWRTRLGTSYTRWQAYIQRENRPMDDAEGSPLQ